MTRKTESGDAARLRLRLREWYGRPLGRRLLEEEQRELAEMLPNLFGYYLLQVGCSMDRYLAGASRIRNQTVIDERWPTPPGGGDARVMGMYARPDMLPVQHDYVDVVLLPHTLEFERAPHQVLREAERVLVPEGHVVILGFNPWSLWGLWRLLRWRRREHPLWRGSFRGTLRIKDWLALLGFDTVLTRSYFFRPPLQHDGMMRRLGWLERLGRRWWPFLGGAYIVVAKKRVATLTPFKPRWRPRRSLIRPDMAKPTT